MHHVGRLAETAPSLGIFGGRSEGYVRRVVTGRATGSVHQEYVVAELASGGSVDRHVQAFEEAFYVLSGKLTLEVGGVEEELRAGEFGLIDVGVPHALQNLTSTPVRWLELCAPLPGATGLQDTVFLDDGPGEPDPERGLHRGRFEESQLPKPGGAVAMPGWGSASAGGATLKMLVDRELGASQLNLFVVEYQPGGYIKPHDHPFEEAYFFVEGEIEAVLDGRTYQLRAGDYCWTAVGSMHSFVNRSSAPVRWLETQVPQPPGRYQFRFLEDWERLTGAGRSVD